MDSLRVPLVLLLLVASSTAHFRDDHVVPPPLDHRIIIAASSSSSTSSSSSAQQQPSLMEMVHNDSAHSRPVAACSAAMRGACDAHRKQGVVSCGQCAGAHQAPLVVAGCTQADVAAFCANQTCATHLSEACGRSQRDCSSCSECGTNNTEAGCDASDVATFCDGACAQERQCGASLLQLCEPGAWQCPFA